MRIRVKICGLTTEAAVDTSVEAGADAVGFVLTPSPRRLDLGRARELARRVPSFVARVAVLHEPSADLLEAVCRELAPDVIQCEPSAATRRLDRPFLPVFHDHPDLVAEVAGYRERYSPAVVHVEAPGRGGRGRVADWDRAAQTASGGPIVLAGGLDRDTVGTAIRRVGPWAVDVSSGCESAPGIKCPDRIVGFVRAVRSAEPWKHDSNNVEVP